jgi:hypothetical protein
MVQINPSTSSFANVKGTATLGGATLDAVYANGSYVAKQYTILTAGSVSGTFGATVNTNLPSGFKASLSYDAGHAYLDLALAFVAPPTSGLSGNQSNVGNALINYFNSHGGIPLVYGGLTAAGLTQASGETSTGTQQTTFDAMTQFMGGDDRSVCQRSGRWGDGRRADRLCLYSKYRCRTRCLCGARRGGAGCFLRAALERVGLRLRRLADHRR